MAAKKRAQTKKFVSPWDLNSWQKGGSPKTPSGPFSPNSRPPPWTDVTARKRLCSGGENQKGWNLGVPWRPSALNPAPHLPLCSAGRAPLQPPASTSLRPLSFCTPSGHLSPPPQPPPMASLHRLDASRTATNGFCKNAFAQLPKWKRYFLCLEIPTEAEGEEKRGRRPSGGPKARISPTRWEKQLPENLPGTILGLLLRRVLAGGRLGPIKPHPHSPGPTSGRAVGAAAAAEGALGSGLVLLPPSAPRRRFDSGPLARREEEEGPRWARSKRGGSPDPDPAVRKSNQLIKPNLAKLFARGPCPNQRKGADGPPPPKSSGPVTGHAWAAATGRLVPNDVSRTWVWRGCGIR